MTTSHENTLKQAYEYFNAEKIDELLAMMVDDVEWPNLIDNIVLTDKEDIRKYWQGQFDVWNVSVIPTAFTPVGDDVIVTIDQSVTDLEGNEVVPLTVVFHRYSFEGDLIKRMTVSETAQ